ncbi:hypothetical protein [Pseudanabaena galeata]|nr:hypothetical protein [Pseudanabaena galeata]
MNTELRKSRQFFDVGKVALGAPQDLAIEASITNNLETFAFFDMI